MTRRFTFLANWPSQFRSAIFTLFLLALLTSCASLSSAPYQYLRYQLVDNALVVETPEGEVKFSALPGDAIGVLYPDTAPMLPSFAEKEDLVARQPQVSEQDTTLTLVNGELSAVIKKSDLSVSFYQRGRLLTRQQNYFNKANKRGFNFALDDVEKILGGGERVLGMDRRGHRMPLYNRAHYGYTTESNQMYYSLPLVMSDKKYAVLFDNSASGFLDIGKTQKNTLSFEAVGGRPAYLVFGGDSYPQLLKNYVAVTGTQPLPPRWAFGNYASRFGYRTEKEVRETVDKFFAEDFPLDAVILDLYWFGSDIKGHVGNLDWDETAFPTHQKMIDDLKAKGIKTILITEPFILSSSTHWQDAVANKVLAKDANGDPYRFDFYFGNTGLVDVFDDNAQQWFWQIYQGLFEQGVAGTWGDLGEPEVHPDDALHYLSDNQITARGDEVHNAFGHEWAKLVFENQRKLQPDTRPFIMMRSGFAGSQRYGMIPWTGDVSREWDGLKPQVELSLQMGLQGLAYTHSDLGGFAGGEKFDPELYIRWLEYGVFQPVFRPHAQDHIAAEPVFHDQQTKDILREYVKLRYRLMPYLYTMAYQNSTSGMPMMRPLFFSDESNAALFDEKDTYLWGDSLLVSPITKAGETQHKTRLPAGVWFDYWNDTRYQGNQQVDIPVTLKTIPVLARAGAFIPMVGDMKTSREYDGKAITLHYYADQSVTASRGEMYEDDGESFDAIKNKSFDLLQFNAVHQSGQLQFRFTHDGKGYQGMPQTRRMALVIHNWQQAPAKISWQGKQLPAASYQYAANEKTLRVTFDWQQDVGDLVVDSLITQ